mmetsp:Transcript_61703/g.133684  ORF Transcript_61703/g.133684 Transcript_61703/m.133684 type:complete len:415 (-) Transcript_61703:100-1344(-)
MRNIALLEWGPASLFHIQPREQIKVRTEWLEGGPVMPPFLGTPDEARNPELRVRYALSAFEDLNSTIRNLRRCFGFPYQEYIGYLNTLARTHRARREHEALVDRLRKWAIFGNVDAVVWIDYAKSNQPPGSFKMGPRDSRPFNSAHMEVCTNGVVLPGGRSDKDGGESEAWSDADEEQPAGQALSEPQPRPAAVEASPGAVNSPAGSMPGFTRLGRTLRPEGGRPLGGSPPIQSTEPSGKPVGGDGKQRRRPLSSRGSPQGTDRSTVKALLQEEVVPAPGSIYRRTFSPGPGYYESSSSTLKDAPMSFTHRGHGRIDLIMRKVKDMPAPGAYTPKVAVIETPVKLGTFGRAPKPTALQDTPRKLPALGADGTEHKAQREPNRNFYSITTEAIDLTRGFSRTPRYAFSTSPRPWP